MIEIDQLYNIAAENRKKIIQMTYDAGSQGAHMGGSLSLCEIFAVLYHRIMNYNKDLVNDENRDRLILSKGHGAIALYAALNGIGIITDDELKTYKQDDSVITAHPTFLPDKGMEFASGSLGQGLSIGAGVALGLSKKDSKAKVYVVVGDGECDEGSVWEAAAFASANNISNLICIIDKNRLQYDGDTKDVMDMGDISQKWKSFGWDIEDCNGHDIEELVNVFEKLHDRPLAVICNTVKGKGVSFAENNYKWHNSTLTEELYNKAMAEQEKQ